MNEEDLQDWSEVYSVYSVHLLINSVYNLTSFWLVSQTIEILISVV